ncbi:Protein of unknown function NeuD [Flavobacterium indicum GPTSA100-9 = DSM 17447]|uniref:Uncharacterized protein n=1 Tax=Flavobacterium indicum (strain DSM 17447 / CIP 109464 / GPTSA100-9) TaxID=1094466 RepID=H8XT79_FLAIG|nr:acetyltransferase [Flavobacterium indicum]CCG52676.1 Protein of unknown function NeuD [Flavobacterium indicum GPTSA100-9 = DSM 17447]
MNKILAVLGAGELGNQIAHLAVSDSHFDSVVFFDDFAELNSDTQFPIIGKSNAIFEAYTNKLFDALIIAIGYNHLEKKKEYFFKFKDQIPFATIIHSTCWIDATAIIEPGTVIYPNCVIDKGVQIKSNTLLNLSVTVAHDSIIQEHSFLAPRVAISGFVTIGECCFIGTNATIVDSIKISNSIKIGAGSVVIHSLENKAFYAGNPVRKIR